MTNDNKIEQMAHYEVEWWKAHHRREKERLINKMTRLHVLLFGMSYEDAKSTVQYRIKAAGFHDKAETCEDQGGQKKADIYWRKVEENLQKYFALLEEKRIR